MVMKMVLLRLSLRVMTSSIKFEDGGFFFLILCRGINIVPSKHPYIPSLWSSSSCFWKFFCLFAQDLDFSPALHIFMCSTSELSQTVFLFLSLSLVQSCSQIFLCNKLTYPMGMSFSDRISRDLLHRWNINSFNVYTNRS